MSVMTSPQVGNFTVHVSLFDDVFEEDYFRPWWEQDESDRGSSSTSSVTDDGKNQVTTSDGGSTTAPLWLVGSIDQGTSSTKFVLYTKRTGRIAALSQMEHEQLYPQTGWHEHDPVELWKNTATCMRAVFDEYSKRYGRSDSLRPVHPTNPATPVPPLQLAAIGITNQRETTIAWNRKSGRPYHNAIVWDCSRTAVIADELCVGPHQQVPNMNRFRDQTGLPISCYFAGTKVKWLLDNVESLRHDLATQPDQVCFGTVDTWLLYNLTNGEAYKTDVSNASRWLFLDIHSCQWDQALVDTICAPHALPAATALPEICPSSSIFGRCTNASHLPPQLLQVPIASILGDQQAALFGQAAFEPGQAKNTYGTGLFLMMNTGTTPIPSTHGLLTTVAYQIGADGPIHYALEGSISFSGSTIQWLRDQLKIIQTAAETETLATSHNDGLYFVPAFSGLLAPYWQSSARACIVGMSSSHHRGHICRAALEAAAYQTKSVFDAITADSNGIPLTELKVDGGGTNNHLLMQFQADIINVRVVKPAVMETTSMGAAFAAGLAVGVWDNLHTIQQLWSMSKTFTPNMSEQDRVQNWKGWMKAVQRSFNWIDHNPDMDSYISIQNMEHKHQSTSTQQPHNTVTTTETASNTSISLIAFAALSLGFILGNVTASLIKK